MDESGFDRVKINYERNLLIENGGFRQWEQCYSYFGQSKKHFDNDIACLHLTSYLACWGMYRGSAFIKSVDAKFHRPIITEIRRKKYRHLRDLKVTASINDQNMAFDLIKKVKGKYLEQMKKQHPNLNKNVQKNLDTLATKVLMGTLACTPAYDKYFKAGLTLEKFPTSLKKFSNFAKLFSESKPIKIRNCIDQVQIYNRNLQDEFNEEANRFYYPDMKILDSYFFLAGKESE